MVSFTYDSQRNPINTGSASYHKKTTTPHNKGKKMNSTEIMYCIRSIETMLQAHDTQRERLMNELKELCNYWEIARNKEGIPLDQFPTPRLA